MYDIRGVYIHIASDKDDGNPSSAAKRSDRKVIIDIAAVQLAQGSGI
jgi:hypothetical protein